MGRRSARGAGRAHLDHVAEHLGADLGEEQLGQRARGDAGGRLPGAGALEHVAGVVEAVLLHADEVGVTRSGLVQRLLGGARGGRHLLLPLRPFGVVDHDRHRRPEGQPVADAAEELDVVTLEAHARAAPEAEAAAGELVADLLDGDGQARGEALDDHRERRAVGLTGGQVTQHADNLRRGRSRIPAGLWRAPLIRPRTADDQLPRYQSRIGVPTSSAVIAPAARNGPKGTAWPLPAQPGRDEEDPDHRAVEEPEEQPEDQLTPADAPERQAQGERQLHVAEAHAARRDQMEHEEHGERDHPGEKAAAEGAEVAVGEEAEREQHQHRQRERVHDAVGQEVGLEVDRGERDERGREHQVRDQRPRIVEAGGHGAEERGVDHGDGDAPASGWRRLVGRRGPEHGLLQGNAGDHGVEEPADHEAQQRAADDEQRPSSIRAGPGRRRCA